MPVRPSVVHVAALIIVRTPRPSPRVIVGAAIVRANQVLACARTDPPEVAGRFEFPGGKVEAGESELEALVRECREELAVTIKVGNRIGADVLFGHGWSVLRIYLAELIDGEPQLLEHSDLRWLGADQLDDVHWLPADKPIVEALRPLLSAGEGAT